MWSWHTSSRRASGKQERIGHQKADGGRNVSSTYRGALNMFSKPSEPGELEQGIPYMAHGLPVHFVHRNVAEDVGQAVERGQDVLALPSLQRLAAILSAL